MPRPRIRSCRGSAGVAEHRVAKHRIVISAVANDQPLPASIAVACVVALALAGVPDVPPPRRRRPTSLAATRAAIDATAEPVVRGAARGSTTSTARSRRSIEDAAPTRSNASTGSARSPTRARSSSTRSSTAGSRTSRCVGDDPLEVGRAGRADRPGERRRARTSIDELERRRSRDLDRPARRSSKRARDDAGRRRSTTSIARRQALDAQLDVAAAARSATPGRAHRARAAESGRVRAADHRRPTRRAGRDVAHRRARAGRDRVRPLAAPSTRGAVSPHHNDPFLVCTRARESGGDYGVVSSSGYYGAYQFLPTTWDVDRASRGPARPRRRAAVARVAVRPGRDGVGALPVAGQRALGRSLLDSASRSARSRRRASTSASEPRRRSAAERSSVSVSACGTATQRRPAAFAAVTPCGESSTASACAGLDAERRARRDDRCRARAWPAGRRPRTRTCAKRRAQPEPLEVRQHPVASASSTRSRGRARRRRLRRASPRRPGRTPPARRAARRGAHGARRRASRRGRPAGSRARASSPSRSSPSIGADLGRPLLDRRRRARRAPRTRRTTPRRPGASVSRIRPSKSKTTASNVELTALTTASPCGSIGLASETPPSAATIWPVTQSSVHSATTACATSRAVPTRPSADALGDPLAVARHRVGRREHRRVGRARRDAVDADAVRPELARGDAHERREPGLRHRVVRHRPVGEEPRHARDRDDRARPLVRRPSPARTRAASRTRPAG